MTFYAMKQLVRKRVLERTRGDEDEIPFALADLERITEPNHDFSTIVMDYITWDLTLEKGRFWDTVYRRNYKYTNKCCTL